MSKITVVDYGASNLLNVVRALEHCGAHVEVTAEPSVVMQAERLVFPGVGAFGDCMAALRSRGLIPAIKEYIATDKLFLGICVGMQVMFDTGEEFGEHHGLGVIPGRVTKIPAAGNNGASHKIPHIGWNALMHPRQNESWEGSILEPLVGSAIPRAAYFVHSYMGVPAHEVDRLANVDYDGVAICAAVRKGNVYGCQFHPEKSGETGLAILNNFIQRT